MGEARLRGTYEERKSRAIAKQVSVVRPDGRVRPKGYSALMPIRLGIGLGLAMSALNNSQSKTDLVSSAFFEV